MTSSVLGVMPLTQVGDHYIGDGRPGPVTMKLVAAYKRLVQKETAGG